MWAIDEWHQPMYIFPRECPRILLWRKKNTTDRDAEKYFGSSTFRMLAYIEKGWEAMLKEAIVYRYELPCHTFTSLDDAGMWVSDETVHPIEKLAYSDLPRCLLEDDVELRVIPSLSVLRDAWDSSLHVSGIRLRNANQRS
nr:DUF6886 family protein [Acaryochloris thomasi]